MKIKYKCVFRAPPFDRPLWTQWPQNYKQVLHFANQDLRSEEDLCAKLSMSPDISNMECRIFFRTAYTNTAEFYSGFSFRILLISHTQMIGKKNTHLTSTASSMTVISVLHLAEGLMASSAGGITKLLLSGSHIPSPSV